MSQSVKQCMTVDLSPLFWQMLLTFRRSTFCCNKTPRLSAARMFVRLYRLLFIHICINYETKMPAFSAWLNIGSIRSLKVTGKDIMLCSMALPSKLCAALHGQFNVGLMCDCKPCGSLDLCASVCMCFVVTCWERADLLALVCDV